MTFFIRNFWKTIIFIVGTLITIFGVIMLFTPGQGILTIIFGLGILATEFVWAKQLNQKLKNYLKKKGYNLKSFVKGKRK